MQKRRAWRFLIAERSQTDKKLHNPSVLKRFHNELESLFGDFITEHVIPGIGMENRDACYVYTIAVLEGADDEFKDFLRDWADILDQRSLYTEGPGAEVELL